MKVVINKRYGGFGLSLEAQNWIKKHKNPIEVNYIPCSELVAYRSHPTLVECVETLGEEANNRFALLKVVEIPDDVVFKINEYDGLETIVECSREWA